MEKRLKTVQYLKMLQGRIIHAFESFEPYALFEKKPWDYEKGTGGGEINLLRGSVFEKAAVNWSGIEGKTFPMGDAQGAFFATGISLITHMHNPHAPTVHMNLRYFQTEDKEWFGGGYDLTPMGFFYEEDKELFHGVAKKTLDAFDPALYPQFSQAAKEYFFIPHWNKERGVGGIFFDHFFLDNFEESFAIWKALGDSFLDAILPIYQRRTQQPYVRSDKEKQIKLRAHYVEFNLLYDRGTKFGFQSGGNPEAILCSMPPSASW